MLGYRFVRHRQPLAYFILTPSQPLQCLLPYGPCRVCTVSVTSHVLAFPLLNALVYFVAIN